MFIDQFFPYLLCIRNGGSLLLVNSWLSKSVCILSQETILSNVLEAYFFHSMLLTLVCLPLNKFPIFSLVFCLLHSEVSTTFPQSRFSKSPLFPKVWFGLLFSKEHNGEHTNKTHCNALWYICYFKVDNWTNILNKVNIKSPLSWKFEKLCK